MFDENKHPRDENGRFTTKEKKSFKRFKKEKIEKDVNKLINKTIKNADNQKLYEMDTNAYNVVKDNYKRILKDTGLSDDEINEYLKKNDFDLMAKLSYIINQIKDAGKKRADEFINKNFLKIKGQHTIDDDLKDVNPNYYNDINCKRNCQRCVIVYELRRRGYDVEAYPDDNSGFENVKWLTQLYYKNSEYYNNDKNIKDNVKNRIAKYDNSRWMVNVQWSKGGGHTFIADNTTGAIRFIDPQTNNTNVEFYFDELDETKKTEIIRLDDADFGIGIIKTGFSPKKE